MQNTLFLALLRPIFALKTKIAPPDGIWDENWSRTWCYMEQKNSLSALTKTFFSLFFFFFFFRRSLEIGQKNSLIFSEELFFNFGDHLNLGLKIDSICVKTNENLGQDRLMLVPASKTAPQCKFLATRLTTVMNMSVERQGIAN